MEGISALFDGITILHVSFGMPKFPVYRIDDRPTSRKFTANGIFRYKLQTSVFFVGNSDCSFITGNLKTLKKTHLNPYGTETPSKRWRTFRTMQFGTSQIISSVPDRLSNQYRVQRVRQ